MVPILACSVGVVAIAIERTWTLRPAKIIPSDVLGRIWHEVRLGSEMSRDRLIELHDSSPLGRILAAGLSNAVQGREVMKSSIDETAAQVVHELERFLAPLGTIAAIAPLLGLLGTVIGMIKVFSALVLQGTGTPGVLAGGISEALITTAAGLTVAIPAMVVNRYFERRVESLVVSMEEQAGRLVDAMHGNRLAPERRDAA